MRLDPILFSNSKISQKNTCCFLQMFLINYKENHEENSGVTVF